jgi:hypothetical protein
MVGVAFTDGVILVMVMVTDGVIPVGVMDMVMVGVLQDGVIRDGDITLHIIQDIILHIIQAITKDQLMEDDMLITPEGLTLEE